MDLLIHKVYTVTSASRLVLDNEMHFLLREHTKSYAWRLYAKNMTYACGGLGTGESIDESTLKPCAQEAIQKCAKGCRGIS